eukprot:3417530-Pleurochrysis_carterae.AAC.1
MSKEIIPNAIDGQKCTGQDGTCARRYINVRNSFQSKLQPTVLTGKTKVVLTVFIQAKQSGDES